MLPRRAKRQVSPLLSLPAMLLALATLASPRLGLQGVIRVQYFVSFLSGCRRFEGFALEMRESWTSIRATAEGTLNSVIGCNRTPQCSRLASRLRSHSVKMIQVPGSCESNVKGALDTTRSTRLLSTTTLSGVSKSGSATLFAGSSRSSEKGWEPCHRRGDAQFGDRV